MIKYIRVSLEEVLTAPTPDARIHTQQLSRTDYKHITLKSKRSKEKENVSGYTRPFRL